MHVAQYIFHDILGVVDLERVSISHKVKSLVSKEQLILLIVFYTISYCFIILLNNKVVIPTFLKVKMFETIFI